MRGKINVGGDSRTRTFDKRVGVTSGSSLSIPVTYGYTFGHTMTGSLGIQIWVFGILCFLT